MDRRLIRDLDILTLQLFIAVCEEGTLTRAAQRETIAPSAVSKRLSELEAALGVELFVRRANGMTPTSAGQTMLHYSRSILQNFESAGVELKEYALGIRGYIRMRANLSSIVQFLPEDLGQFLVSHPQVKIDLIERPSRVVVDEVETGLAELGICVCDAVPPGLNVIPYRQDRLVVALRPDHPLAKRREVAFRDTLDFDHIGLHADSAIFARALTTARQNASSLQLKIHVPSFDALCRMVQANLGIGVIPDRAFELIGAPLGLNAVPLADDWALRQLEIVHRGEQTLSAAARILLDRLSKAEAHARSAAGA